MLDNYTRCFFFLLLSSQCKDEKKPTKKTMADAINEKRSLGKDILRKKVNFGNGYSLHMKDNLQQTRQLYEYKKNPRKVRDRT